MEKSEITFQFVKEGEEGKEHPARETMLKINRDGFYYKGQRVDDVNQVYDRFNEWLTLVRKETKLE